MSAPLQFDEASLVGEGTHEAVRLELGQDARGDAAAEIDAARRHQLERQVAGLGAVDVAEQIQRQARAVIRAFESRASLSGVWLLSVASYVLVYGTLTGRFA